MLGKFNPKSEFSRNVVTLMTGTTIAQAIPVAISPILIQIYTSEDFGMFSLCLSIASGRYELAVILPKKYENAINIVPLSISISSFVSFIVLVLFEYLNNEITSLLENPEISHWLYVIFVTVLLMGIY